MKHGMYNTSFHGKYEQCGAGWPVHNAHNTGCRLAASYSKQIIITSAKPPECATESAVRHQITTGHQESSRHRGSICKHNSSSDAELFSEVPQ